MTIERIVKTEEDMLALGKRIAERLDRHGFIALYGDLGAGKTVFARGVAQSFGVDHVSSPTFTIVCEYPTEPKLYKGFVETMEGRFASYSKREETEEEG